MRQRDAVSHAQEGLLAGQHIDLQRKAGAFPHGGDPVVLRHGGEGFRGQVGDISVCGGADGAALQLILQLRDLGHFLRHLLADGQAAEDLRVGVLGGGKGHIVVQALLRGLNPHGVALILRAVIGAVSGQTLAGLLILALQAFAFGELCAVRVFRLFHGDLGLRADLIESLGAVELRFGNLRLRARYLRLSAQVFQIGLRREIPGLVVTGGAALRL